MQGVSRGRLAEFVAACHRAASLGLVRCSSGNLSARLDEERMLVTASRAWMAELTEEQVAICRIRDGTALTDMKPSVETRFHAAILRQRPDVNVVLHFQSPAATAFACADCESVDFNVLPEIPYYIGPIAIVPYLPPGSPELAEAVTEAMRTHRLAILRNHGQVTAGASFHHAIQRAAFFELACEIILRLGDRAEPLPGAAIAQLRAAASEC